MKKNIFAEEYAQEMAIKAQYHEAKKTGSKEGLKCYTKVVTEVANEI